MTNPFSGAVHDPEMMDQADERAQELLDELKEKASGEIRDIGPLRKEVSVVVPQDVIAAQVEHNFDELRSDAVVPGFRRGRAPRALIEKRFGADVRQSLKTTVVGQSYFAVIEKENLDTLGDPLFRIKSDEGEKLVDLGEALPHFSLPDEGDFTFTCEVEVRPEFELPNLEGVPIKTPDVTITDEQVEAELQRRAKLFGRLTPVEDGATAEDTLIADVVLFGPEGEQVKKEESVRLGVRPVRLDGVPLQNLAEVLGGVKPGEERTAECTFPDDYDRTDLRGKNGKFVFRVHEVKRMEPAPIDKIVADYGFTGEQELRDFIRDELDAEKEDLIERAKKEQVFEYLLNNTQLELPEQLSARQTDRAIIRRVVEARKQGLPEEEIDKHMDELRTGAKEQAVRDLKLAFILDKAAQQLDVSVTDEEVNTEIARIARRYDRRFDRVRDELQRENLLPQIADSIRTDKLVRHVLASATFETVKAEDAEKSSGE